MKLKKSCLYTLPYLNMTPKKKIPKENNNNKQMKILTIPTPYSTHPKPMATSNSNSSSKQEKLYHLNNGTSLPESNESYGHIEKESHQQQKLVNTNNVVTQKTLEYQSDSKLLDLKNLEKNKSNLFMIKSYSFIDKTNTINSNNKFNNNLKGKQNMPEFDKFHTLTLDEIENAKTGKRNQKQEKQQNLSEELEKPKKPPKLKKVKKSKSTYDSTENLEELQKLLRRPPSVKSKDEASNSKRPLSLPATQNHHKPVTKAKTVDDIETPRLKRDSFFRQSLQSIRKSFSSSKKTSQMNLASSSSYSSASSSSNCSSSSVPNKKSKTKDHVRDIGNLKDVDESNYLIAVAEEEDQVDTTTKPNSVLITLNDNEIIEQHQKQQHLHHHHHQLHAIDNSDYIFSILLKQPASLHTKDSLAVLSEEDEKDLSSCVNSNNNNNHHLPRVISEQRSTTSVSTLAQFPTDSSLSPMAPLQTHTECQSVQCLNTLDKDYKSLSSSSTTTTGSQSSPTQQKTKRAFQHQLSIPESLQVTSIGCVTSSENSSARSLKHSATSLTPLQTLNSTSSLRSISPSRRSASSNSSSTAKHELQSTAAATAAAAATATTSNGNNASTTAIATTASSTPPEKEKKRKEISSSRVKKFHRHFSQVSKDEKLINYFSCALVSDILLQGHLYITDQHFAFYSNVFGYVTKVVIPTSSVTKISKEKTAKIIPNAVGVATADERHVFGSFLSREAAFRLMCSVCPPLGVPEILPKDPVNIEVSEEYSIEDDSSCSISGNESPAQAIELKNNNNINGNSNNINGNESSQTLLRRKVVTPNLQITEITAAPAAADKLRHSDIPINAKKATNTTSSRASVPLSSAALVTNATHYITDGGTAAATTNNDGDARETPTLTPTHEEQVEDINSKLTIIAGCASTTTTATSTPTPSTSSMPTTVMTLPITKAKQIMNIFRSVNNKLMLHIKFPTEIHVVYLGVMLSLLLALFSIFLLYRILDIEAKTNSYRSPIEFNWRSGNDDEIFSEALRFQRQLQLKSAEEAQNILKTNLEQIAKVRRSLETLSMLIHDRSSSFVSTHTNDSD